MVCARVEVHGLGKKGAAELEDCMLRCYNSQLRAVTDSNPRTGKDLWGKSGDCFRVLVNDIQPAWNKVMNGRDEPPSGKQLAEMIELFNEHAPIRARRLGKCLARRASARRAPPVARQRTGDVGTLAAIAARRSASAQRRLSSAMLQPCWL